MPVAVITGASRGLGRATALALAQRGWSLVLVARDAAALEEVAEQCRPASVTTVPGDLTEPAPRDDVVAAASALGGPDLLVNNAAHVGPPPLRTLARSSLDELMPVFAINFFAPLALMLATLPELERRRGTILNLTSDAALGPQQRLGAYCSTKAALDSLTAVVGVESPNVRAYALDPGAMRTDLHQQVFAGQDISDRAAPESVVPAVLRLLDERPPSGRFVAADLLS